MTQDPPDPVYYLTPGEGVSCLRIQENHLFAGTCEGNIKIYTLDTWQLTETVEAFSPGGILWLDLVNNTLVTQARFAGVKLFHRSEDSWRERVEFHIQHTGFCAGYIERTPGCEDTVMLAPSDTGEIMVSKLVDSGEDTFIRPIVTLTKSGVGSVMSMVQWSDSGGKTLVSYESGHCVVWDWSNNCQMLSVDLSPQLGTLMSCSWDLVKGRGVVVGSEDTIVVLDTDLNIVRERKVTNKGMGKVVIRQDSKLAITGGWDGRLRLFSWLKPDKLKPLAVLQYHKDSVETIVSRDNMIVAGSKDGKISVWRIY